MIIESLASGGKERQAVELLRAFIAQKNLEIQVAILSEAVAFPSVFDMDLKLHFISRTGDKRCNIIRAIFRLCRDFKPDIIHTWGIFVTLCALPAAKMLRIKILNGSIRFAVPFKMLSRKWLYAGLSFLFSDYIVANSSAGLKAQRLYNSRKHFIIRNGFDPARLLNLTPPDKIKSKFLIKTKFVIGMVGSFNDAKDYRTFVNSALLVLEMRKDVTFLCVGAGPGLEEIKRFVPPGSRDFFTFTGRQENVEEIINIFDIGVLTCNTNGHAEGLSNSIMEYMALGKPVIATDSGGNNEIVDDRKTGYIIRPFDPVELGEKMNRLLNDASKRRQMGQAGKRKIEKEFGSRAMADRYIVLYKKLLG